MAIMGIYPEFRIKRLAADVNSKIYDMVVL